MKKLVSMFLALTAFFSITGSALSQSASTERVYVRGEIREAIDMTEEQLAALMNEGYQNGRKLKLYDMPAHWRRVGAKPRKGTAVGGKVPEKATPA